MTSDKISTDQLLENLNTTPEELLRQLEANVKFENYPEDCDVIRLRDELRLRVRTLPPPQYLQ